MTETGIYTLHRLDERKLHDQCNLVIQEIIDRQARVERLPEKEVEEEENVKVVLSIEETWEEIKRILVIHIDGLPEKCGDGSPKPTIESISFPKYKNTKVVSNRAFYEAERSMMEWVNRFCEERWIPVPREKLKHIRSDINRRMWDEWFL